MRDEDDPVAQGIRTARWHQGDIVSPRFSEAVVKASIDAYNGPSPKASHLIVLTQDCDLLRHSEIEPYVEFIAASVIDGSGDPQLEAGQSTRRLHIRCADQKTWLDISIHDRFRIPKKTLAGDIVKDSAALDETAKRQIRQWVARRYTRRPFPDAFEQRLNPRSGSIRKLFKRPEAKLISTIYIATSDEELPNSVDYEVDVLLTACGSHIADGVLGGQIDDFEQALYERFQAKAGISFSVDDRDEPRLRVISEDDLTLGMLRRYKRFDADYRSSADDADSPPAGIDEEVP